MAARCAANVDTAVKHVTDTLLARVMQLAGPGPDGGGLSPDVAYQQAVAGLGHEAMAALEDSGGGAAQLPAAARCAENVAAAVGYVIRTLEERVAMAVRGGDDSLSERMLHEGDVLMFVPRAARLTLLYKCTSPVYSCDRYNPC